MPFYFATDQKTGRNKRQLSPAVTFPLAYLDVDSPYYIADLDKMATLATKGGALNITEGINTTFYIREDFFTQAVLSALLQIPNLVIEDLDVWVKMSTAKYATAVPVGISNRTYLDETETEIVRKWNEWHSENNVHYDATDGDKLVPGNSWNGYLTHAELAVLAGLTGYTLYPAHEGAALRPAE